MTEEEFKQTVMPHHQMMLAEALRLLRNRDDALDCLQDAITALWKTRKTLHEVENIRAYCLRTVANKALEMLRRQAGDASGPPAAASEEEPPDAALERSERAALLKKAIMQLPDNERKIVVMRVIKEMTGEEIAAATGLSHSNVRVLLHRARQRLKEYIDKHNGL